MLFSIVIVFLLQADGLPDLLKIFLIASMEMTTGVKEAAKLLSFPYSGAAVCGALTFGGFSGLFQTKAVISSNKNSTGLSIRHYLIWKLCHAGLSFGMFLLLSDLSF